MKKSVLQFALSLGLFAAPFAVLAQSNEQAYVQSYQGRTDIPVPVSVVAPEVSSRYAGRELKVVFVVNEAGKPENIELPSDVSGDLGRQLLTAVAQWEFRPAQVDGKPVARRVMLPVRIADEFGGTFVALR